MDHHELENGTILSLDFRKLSKVAACGEDLIPAVAQDAETGEVLIVGYANQLALDTLLKRVWQLSGAQVGTNCGSKEKHREIT